MTTTAIAPLSPEEFLSYWLEELQAIDHAKSTVEGFLAWDYRKEKRPLTFSTLTPIILVSDCNHVRHTQYRATSTMNERSSVLQAFCAWLMEKQYLKVNLANCLNLVGWQNASSRTRLDDIQANTILCQARTFRNPCRISWEHCGTG